MSWFDVIAIGLILRALARFIVIILALIVGGPALIIWLLVRRGNSRNGDQARRGWWKRTFG